MISHFVVGNLYVRGVNKAMGTEKLPPKEDWLREYSKDGTIKKNEENNTSKLMF